MRAALTARAAWEGTSGAHGHEHPAGGEPDHGHAHPGGPHLAWLLALPAIALPCVPPPALGSALPTGDPVEPSPAEFASRAACDSGYPLRDRTVRHTGFVTRDGGHGGGPRRGGTGGRHMGDGHLAPMRRAGLDGSLAPALDVTTVSGIPEPSDP